MLGKVRPLPGAVLVMIEQSLHTLACNFNVSHTPAWNRLPWQLKSLSCCFPNNSCLPLQGYNYRGFFFFFFLFLFLALFHNGSPQIPSAGQNLGSLPGRTVGHPATTWFVLFPIRVCVRVPGPRASCSSVGPVDPARRRSAVSVGLQLCGNA